MKTTYKQITADEQDQIALFMAGGFNLNHIARKLGRNRSTISREIRRNGAAKYKSYTPHPAEARSKRTINSRNSSARSESTGIINLPFRLAYTFNNLKTQVFLGSDVIDLVRFDINQQIAIKQQINGFGMLQAGLQVSSIVTEVWKDPYPENKRRSKTDRDVMGIRLVWDRIMDSEFKENPRGAIGRYLCSNFYFHCPRGLDAALRWFPQLF